MADVVDRQILSLTQKYNLHFRSASSPIMAASCCRNLFGQPEPGELQRDLQLHRDHLHRQSVQRWNFDFESERPLSGRFDWQLDTAATRETESCGRLPLTEDSNDDDQSGGERLHPVQIPSYSDTTVLCSTTPATHQPGIQSLTGSSAASTYVPDFVLPTRRKRRTNQQPTKERCGSASARRRTVGKRRSQLVQSAGAARVTGTCPRISYVS